MYFNASAWLAADRRCCPRGKAAAIFTMPRDWGIDVTFLGHPKWIAEPGLSACWQYALIISYRLSSQNNSLPSVCPTSQKIALLWCCASKYNCWKGALATVKWWLIWGKEAWPLIFALNKADCAYLCAPSASLSACQNVIFLPSLNIKLWNTSCK